MTFKSAKTLSGLLDLAETCFAYLVGSVLQRGLIKMQKLSSHYFIYLVAFHRAQKNRACPWYMNNTAISALPEKKRHRTSALPGLTLH